MNRRLLTQTLLATVLSVSFALPARAEAVQYTLDPSHTSVVWFANHFGFSNPSGKFANIKGTLSLDEANPANSSLDVAILISSVMTGVEKLDAHLKTDAFFDTEKFPSAYYVSKKVELTGKNTAKVEGALTLRGVTKPVTLDVTFNKMGESPVTHNKTAGFSATGTIKRSEFGINYGLPGVADDVKLVIESEAFASSAATPEQSPAAKPQ